MSAHTPGPWHCGTFRESGKAPGIDIGAENNSNVGIAHHQHDDRTAYETKANARLIAAAPELLACLQAWVAGCGDEHFSTKDECHELIKTSGNLIAKTLGK